MKTLIAVMLMLSGVVAFAEEPAKSTAKEEPKTEAKPAPEEKAAPEEKPLDNKALIAICEKIAKIKEDKKKTDVEKKELIAAIDPKGKRFEIKCEPTFSKENKDGTYETGFEALNTKEVKFVQQKAKNGWKESYSKLPVGSIGFRIYCGAAPAEVGTAKGGNAVTLCGRLKTTPEIDAKMGAEGLVGVLATITNPEELSIKAGK